MTKAEIISVGNELLNGSTLNANATYIARRLHETGIPVIWIQTVRDEAVAIRQALNTAVMRSQVILITGGLGPTPDDLTKPVLVEYFKSQLVFREDILQTVKERFEARGMVIPEINRQMAMVPDNAEIITNTIGTAPGLLFKQRDCLIFVMPGVPREMEVMLELSIIPRLKQECPQCQIRTDLFRTTGIPESALYEKIAAHLSAFPTYEIAFLPGLTGVDLRVIRRDEETQRHETFENFKKILYNLIGDFIYTTENLELEAVLGNLLHNKQLTIAVAESVTGGLVQEKLTRVPGSSDYFLGGMVTYSNASKIKFLDVQPPTIETYGAVSEPVAKEMAIGVQEKFSSDIGLSTTGIAGPAGATATKPVGLVYIGMSYKSRIVVQKYLFGNDRETNKQRAAEAALDLVRRNI